LMRSSK